MKTIGFIGLGIMGKSMAANLIKSGYSLSVYSRSKEKINGFLQETGARWCASPAECAAGQDAVITMVGYPRDVEEVYFGKNGIFSSAASGAYLIDMTTTDPKLSQNIYETGNCHRLHVLDAPVSGGESGAKNATLSIMVGGNRQDFDDCLPLFQAMGKTIIYEGPAGAGQHTKMANQIAIAGALAGACEALAYGERAGLNTETMFQSISQGAAGSWQMTNLMPKMIQNDDTPGFFLKHLLKDLEIAGRQNEQGCFPMLEQICSECADLVKQGFGDLGTQALIKYYRNKKRS